MSQISICFKASTLGHTSKQTCPTAGQLKLSSRGAKNRATLANRPPLLFGLIFNALLLALWATGVGCRTVSGLRSPAHGFADDLVLITRSCGDMSRLLEAVAGFCAWSWMRITREKSVITGFDYKERASLSTESILYVGAPLTCLSADEAFAYLGVRASLASRLSPSPPPACEGKIRYRRCLAPCLAIEKEHILSACLEAPSLLPLCPACFPQRMWRVCRDAPVGTNDTGACKAR
jgi:hypothetical protein